MAMNGVARERCYVVASGTLCVCCAFYFCSPFSGLSSTLVQSLPLACVIIGYIACRLADRRVGICYIEGVYRFNGRSSRSQPTITNENACTSIVGIVVPETE